MRTCLLTAAFLVLAACASHCHEGLGGIDALPQASTRGLALGETGLTELGEGECFMTNVSCLTSLGGVQARLTYGNLFKDLGSSRTILLGAMSMGPELEYPGEGYIANQFGIGAALDRTGVELSGGSGWASNVIYIGLAWAPIPYMSLGLMPKIISTSSDLESGKVSGFAMDWGMRLDISSHSSLGLVVRNIPGNAGWTDGDSETLPAVYSLGAHFVLPYDLRAEAIFALSGSVDDRFGAGLEAAFLDAMLAVRAGGLWINGGQNRSAVTAGFGLELSTLKFDYAVKFDADWATGTTHRFSIRFDI